MEDVKIIDLFFNRDESAIEEVSKKYGSKCLNLSCNIVKNISDAQECVNDSYYELWKLIPPNNPNPLLTFLLKIVRNISLRKQRFNLATKRNNQYDAIFDELDFCIPSNIRIEEELYEKELLTSIERFLDSLSKENRVIFIKRYWFGASLSQISTEVNLTEKNVSVRLTRIRKQLYKYLKGEELI